MKMKKSQAFFAFLPVIFKKSQILEYDNFNEMYEAFNNGEVEALILNNLTLKHATLKNKIANYFLDSKFFKEKDEHVFIFPKNSRYFARISKDPQDHTQCLPRDS